MAYNKKNRLKKIIAIQETTLQQKQRGITQKWIFENIIRDKYMISLKTFYEYLATNAKRELKELERVEGELIFKQTTENKNKKSREPQK